MCGRAYEMFSEAELETRYLLGSKLPSGTLEPSYNVTPTQLVPVLRAVIGDRGTVERRLDRFHWQLVPPWEPEFKTRISTINARSETVFESRLYGPLILRQRLILPLSGFYEWKRDGARKRPFAIRLKNEPIMSVAGVWSEWRREGETSRFSFAILTTASNELMSGIHDRMPVILSRADEDEWLDPANASPERLRSLLRPCPAEWLEAVEVSALVNSPRNNSRELLNPMIDLGQTDESPQLTLF